MPRGFSEREKALIRESLLAKGRELFVAYGLKKTNIEDLAKAAGISKGAFYQFYGSKEELLIAVLEQFEAEYQLKVLAAIAACAPATAADVKALLVSLLLEWQSDPMFAQFAHDDLVMMLRKVPPELAERAIRNDDAFAARMIDAWAAAGLTIRHDPRMLAALCRALFFVAFHRQDFAADIYPPMMDVLSELITGYLLGPPAGGLT